VQDPERYLEEERIRLICAVHPNRRARLDPEFRAFVNHEVFFVHDKGALRTFRRNPIRYSGLLTDPVTRVRFQPTSRSPRWDYRGRPYYFQDRLNLRTFQAMPDSFAVRKGA
jgi:YHS domain-containing protein